MSRDALIGASLGSQVGSALLQDQAITSQSEAIQQDLEFNQELAKIEAQRIRELGRIEESRLRRRKRRILGRQRVNIGASGFTTSGSKLDALARNAAELELDALNARFVAELRAQGREIQAAGFETQRERTRNETRSTRAANILSGTVGLLATADRFGLLAPRGGGGAGAGGSS